MYIFEIRLWLQYVIPSVLLLFQWFLRRLPLLTSFSNLLAFVCLFRLLIYVDWDSKIYLTNFTKIYDFPVSCLIPYMRLLSKIKFLISSSPLNLIFYFYNIEKHTQQYGISFYFHNFENIEIGFSPLVFDIFSQLWHKPIFY